MQLTLEPNHDFFELKDPKGHKGKTPPDTSAVNTDNGIENSEIFNLKDTPSSVAPDEHVKMIAGEGVETLESRLSRERTQWKVMILDMAKKLTNIQKIAELQVELYSNRQIALEHNHFLMSLLGKLNKEYKKKLGKKWEEYMHNHDRKMKMGETNVQVEAALAAEKEKVDMLQNQIEYFNETIKTIDNIIYGLKYRLNIEDFRR